jgi:hypothetical protein
MVRNVPPGSDDDAFTVVVQQSTALAESTPFVIGVAAATVIATFLSVWLGVGLASRSARKQHRREKAWEASLDIADALNSRSAAVFPGIHITWSSGRAGTPSSDSIHTTGSNPDGDIPPRIRTMLPWVPNTIRDAVAELDEPLGIMARMTVQQLDADGFKAAVLVLGRSVQLADDIREWVASGSTDDPDLSPWEDQSSQRFVERWADNHPARFDRHLAQVLTPAKTPTDP